MYSHRYVVLLHVNHVIRLLLATFQKKGPFPILLPQSIYRHKEGCTATGRLLTSNISSCLGYGNTPPPMFYLYIRLLRLDSECAGNPGSSSSSWCSLNRGPFRPNKSPTIMTNTFTIHQLERY